MVVFPFDQMVTASQQGNLTNFRQALDYPHDIPSLTYVLGQCFYLTLVEGHYDMASWLLGEATDYTPAETKQVKLIPQTLATADYYMYSLDNIIYDLCKKYRREPLEWLLRHGPPIDRSMELTFRVLPQDRDQQAQFQAWLEQESFTQIKVIRWN